jgi:outer membrane protein assembly factor BamB
MNIKLRKPSGLRLLISLFLLGGAVVLGVIAPPARADSLYIGDGSDNSVKRFDASTGNFLGNFVDPSSSEGLSGPRGLIFTDGRLIVVNQNSDTPFDGEILSYIRSTGAFLDAIVPCNNVTLYPSRICDPNAPFLPRGIIRGSGRTLYVANYTEDDSGPFFPGDVRKFDVETGLFLGSFDTTPFPSTSFFPRGLVRGPDRLIYVSITGDQGSGDNLTGKILRFNTRTGKFVDIFASNTDLGGCSKHLHRPEGLVFGPDNNLYVTAFRANTDDNDKVLVFNKNGRCINQIDLAPPQSQVGVGAEGRAFAQALLFGPKGRLFIPINGPIAGVSGPVTGIHTGEVRRYNVKTKAYDIFIAAGGNLANPWYMTFGETDPSTLEYDD